jgi:hypothetical protein
LGASNEPKAARRNGALRLRVRARVIVALAGMIVLGLLALPAGSASAKTRSFTIAATNSSFVHTGVVLARGGSVKVKVSGDGKCGPGCHPGDEAGYGSTCETRAQGALSPGPAGPNQDIGIFGRFGQGKIFMIGHGGTFKGVGELSVVYNDCAGYYFDNTGSFTVKVTYKALPHIDSISPKHGSPAGGTAITIKGSGFGKPGTKDQVYFCAHNVRPASGDCLYAKRIVVHSDTRITAVTPSVTLKTTSGETNVYVGVPVVGGLVADSANSSVFAY